MQRNRILSYLEDLQLIYDCVNNILPSTKIFTRALIFSNLFKTTVDSRHHRPCLQSSLFEMSNTPGSNKRPFVSTIIDGTPYFSIPLYFFRFSLGKRSVSMLIICSIFTYHLLNIYISFACYLLNIKYLFIPNFF